MSSTLNTPSNVKISELTALPLAYLNNNAYIAIPISKENDDKTAWSSYRIGLEHLSKLIDNNTTLTTLSSTVNTVSETANNAYTYAGNAYTRANSAWTYAENAYARANNAYQYAGSAYSNADDAKISASNAYDKAVTVEESLTYISQSLAKYGNGSSYFNYTYELSQDSPNNYINANGEVVSGTGFFIYDCAYQLKAGDLCSVYIGGGVLDQIHNLNISIVSKVHEKNGTYTYEPLPRQYYMYDDAHYVFFANEDMKVKFSLPNESTVSSEGLTVYKYGAFKELGNAFLGVNSELMKVLVEAITKNRKDIESLYESIKSPGDISVSSIECDDFPSVQGEPMVVVKNRKPTYDSAYFGPEYPNRIGQIWVNTANETAYIATHLGNINGWKQITLG